MRIIPLLTIVILLYSIRVGAQYPTWVGDGSRRMMDTPLLSNQDDYRGSQQAALTRPSVSICDEDNGSTVLSLSSGEVCQSSSYGVRVSGEVTNKARNSSSVSSWVASSTTVTEDYATAPDGTTTADRVQMNATGDYVRNGTSGFSCTPNAPITISLWIKSNTTSCSIYIGNAYGSGFPAIIELVTVPTAWTRVWTYKVASTLGHCHTLIYRYDASATCTDFDVWENQIEESAHSAPSQGCHTGAAEATCYAETLILDPSRISTRRGSLTMTVTPGDISSSEYESDVVLLEIDASSTWRIYYDESAGNIVFAAGGQTVSAAQALSSWSSYDILVGWHDGMPITLSIDGASATSSVGNYSEPTWNGDLYLGSSKTGTSQGAIMESEVLAYSWYR